MGPAAAAIYVQGGGALLWVVSSILAQVILNTELMRYTLCRGEPAFKPCHLSPYAKRTLRPHYW